MTWVSTVRTLTTSLPAIMELGRPVPIDGPLVFRKLSSGTGIPARKKA